MYRLANYDLTRGVRSRRAKRAVQYSFGAACTAAMIGLRSVFDLAAPGAGPFALLYPTVLLATLYGHLRAGLFAYVLGLAYLFYAVLPPAYTFKVTCEADVARLLLNAACAIIVIVFAEAFRKSAHGAMAAIKQDADRRLLRLAEVEHRTKNNFALVASMLEIQQRRLSDPSLQAHLADAVGRVRTFADAYSTLAMDQAEDSDVAVGPYLELLLDRLESAAVPANVRLYREIDTVVLPRETAVAVGLYLNEALSNALKYAFPGGRKGTVGVFFHVGDNGGWSLTIDDDGEATNHTPSPGGGLGASLMTAFAQQAGAVHSAGPMPGGFRTALATAGVETPLPHPPRHSPEGGAPIGSNATRD